MRRLSPAFLTVAMLGVVGLLVAAYFGKKLLFAQTPAPQDPLVNVPMAVTALKAGTRITEAHLARGPSRESRLTRDIVRTDRVLLGRIVKNDIAPAQPISTNDLYPPGEGPLPDIEPGMRAVVVPLSAPSSAIVGQYVDVHFTPNSDPNASETGGRIMTLFKGVKILEIGSGGNSMRGGGTVKLELTPEQANIVLLATDHGTLNMVYTPEGRGTGGVAVNDADRATLFEILGYTPREEPEPVKPFLTEVFHGSGRRTNRYRDGLLDASGPALDDDLQDIIEDSLDNNSRGSRGRGNNSPRGDAGGAGERANGPGQSGPTANSRGRGL